jgi:hypothetical protein
MKVENGKKSVLMLVYKRSESDPAKRVHELEIKRAAHMDENILFDILRELKREGLITMDSAGGVKITVDGIRAALNYEDTLRHFDIKKTAGFVFPLILGVVLGLSAWMIPVHFEKDEKARQDLHVRQVLINDMTQEAYSNFKVMKDPEVPNVHFNGSRAKLFESVYLKTFSFRDERVRNIILSYIDGIDPLNRVYSKGTAKKKFKAEMLSGISTMISNAIKILEETKENSYDFNFYFDESILSRDMQKLADWE